MEEFISKDSEKQRDRGKFGIRTSSTLKNNSFDSQYIKGAYFKREGEDVLYSMNKGKLWQSIEDLKIQIQSQAVGDERVEVIEIQSHAELGEQTAVVVGINQPRSGSSFYYKEKRGRNFTREVCVKCNKPSLTDDEALDVIRLTCDDQSTENESDDEVIDEANEVDNASGEDEASGEEDLEGIPPNENRSAKPRSKVRRVKKNSALKMDLRNNGSDVGGENGSANEQGVEPCERITVFKPFAQGQYPLYRETGEWLISQPCMCCFHSQGHVWNLRGTGPKSMNKTKGFRKINDRKINAAVNDVTLNLNKRF